jgi:hypothetical protein
MLAFAHIPTGVTANKGINVNDSKNSTLVPACALNTPGADLKPAGLHLKTRRRLSHKRGPPQGPVVNVSTSSGLSVARQIGVLMSESC